MAAGRRTAESLALSIHGPAGVLDLVVPPGAAAVDVAREYAEQSGLTTVPALFSRSGAPLRPDVALAVAGIGTGEVLVASVAGTGGARPGPSGRAVASRGDPHDQSPGSLSVLWFCLAVSAAVLAGWFTALTPDSALHTTALVLLAAAAVIGVVPVGRFARHRVLAAPAFAAAAAFAVAWDPAPERLPTVLGVAALVGAVAAAVARALDRSAEESLRVWVVVGVSVFLLTAACALLGFAEQVAWALLLLTAMLAARFVPTYAIDVPDQLLIDLERLAVTAWSARDRPTSRRGRTIVPHEAVAAVAARGTRIVTASCVAVLAVTAVSAPLLLVTASAPLDRIGARVQVGLAGAALLLAARSYRHGTARALLRAAGLTCWLALLAAVVTGIDHGTVSILAGTAVGVASLLVVVAVATGRGWRSAWWSRRAEVAEGLCGSAAVAAVLVSVGLFRSLWERSF